MTEPVAGSEDRARLRRSRALEAACKVGDRLGIAPSHPTILKDSNNTIVHLAPAAIVAKVGTSAVREGNNRRLERELSVGLHLAGERAPIAPPTSSVSPGPHRDGATMVTLWEFRQHDPRRRVESSVLATVLKQLHGAFTRYPAPLPNFIDQVEDVGKKLSDSSPMGDLERDDRIFLRTAQRRMIDSLSDLRAPTQALHGEPHLDGNCLLTKDGPVFIDFEAACVGPKEWDLASLPERVAACYGSVDLGLLRFLSLVRSLCIATWCWMQAERAPEVAEAAEFHLSRLRHALGERPSGPV